MKIADKNNLTDPANYPEGVSFAIILMNIMAPLIDRYTIPGSFGGEKNV